MTLSCVGLMYSTYAGFPLSEDIRISRPQRVGVIGAHSVRAQKELNFLRQSGLVLVQIIPQPDVPDSGNAPAGAATTR